MVDETLYSIPWSERSPYVPTVDTLLVWQRNGNARIRMNRLEDKAIQANMALGTAIGDMLFTWQNFRLMIEEQYGDILQDIIDENPILEGEDIGVWWVRVTNLWLANYFSAHNSPTNLLDGWEAGGQGYPPLEGEPIGGMLPSEEPTE